MYRLRRHSAISNDNPVDDIGHLHPMKVFPVFLVQNCELREGGLNYVGVEASIGPDTADPVVVERRIGIREEGYVGEDQTIGEWEDCSACCVD